MKPTQKVVSQKVIQGFDVVILFYFKHYDYFG